MKKQFAAVFATRTRDEWTALFEGTDACCVPVLTLDEAPSHPQFAARGTYVERDGIIQPAPAPRFGGVAADLPAHPPLPGADRDAILRDWGISA